MDNKARELTAQEIQSRIINLPNRPPCMLDRDLAEFYETEVKYVNRAVKRNPRRFPDDFCFQLTKEEVEHVRRRSGTIKLFQDVMNYLPHAFTREGANMLSAVLHTDVAIDRSVMIMRAFSVMEALLHQQAFLKFTDQAQITGERFDMSVKRFKIALDAAKLTGIKDDHQARMAANRITMETTGIDLMEFVRPGYSSASESKHVRISSRQNDKGDETLTRLISAWWDKHGDDEVASRHLYQMIIEDKIPLDLGHGSKRSQKIRLGKMLSKMDGQQIGEYRVVSAGKNKTVRAWKLRAVEISDQASDHGH